MVRVIDPSHFVIVRQSAVISHYRKSKRALRLIEGKKKANECIFLLVSTVELIADLIVIRVEV